MNYLRSDMSLMLNILNWRNREHKPNSELQFLSIQISSHHPKLELHIWKWPPHINNLHHICQEQIVPKPGHGHGCFLVEYISRLIQWRLNTAGGAPCAVLPTPGFADSTQSRVQSRSTTLRWAREAIIDWMAYNVGGAGENRVRDGRWLLLPSTDLACTGAVAAAGRKRHSTPFGSGSWRLELSWMVAKRVPADAARMWQQICPLRTQALNLFSEFL
jgi:hypothetical protein